MAELSLQYRAAAEERYGKGGGSVSAVAKRGYEYAKEHPVEAASYAWLGGYGIKLGAKGITYLAKKKLPELSKKIRTKLGGEKARKTEFKGDKTKGAKQQAEEAKTKYEQVVTRKETVTKEVPGKKVKVKVKDKLGHDVKYKTGPKKGQFKYTTKAGPKVKKITKETRATFEPTWKAVAAQQTPKVKVGTGIVAGGVIAKSLLTGKPTTVGAAEYDDQPAKDDSPGSITMDKKKKRELSGKGMLESSANKPNGRVTMTSTIPQKNEINWATGKPRNNSSTVSAESINTNKSVPSADEIISDYRKGKNRYTSIKSGRTGKLGVTTKEDWRGTKVTSSTPRASKPYVGSSNVPAKSNGAAKTTTTTKEKKLHGSEIFKRRLGGLRKPGYRGGY